MTLTPEQKEHAIELIEMGEKLEAVRYFQEILHIDAEQALTLAEKLEEEIETSPEKEEFVKKQEELIRSGNNVGRLVGMIFMCIGIGLLMVVIYLVYTHQQFEKNAERVNGTLLEYQSYESKNDDGGGYTTMYTPVFAYSFRGKTFRQPGNSSSSVKEYDIGQPVEILVDPENPSEILVNSFMEKWFLPLLLGIMGAVFSGIGYVVFVVLGKSNNRMQ